MFHLTDWFNQIPVGVPGEVKDNLDVSVVASFQAVHLVTSEIPKGGPSKVEVVDFVYF